MSEVRYPGCHVQLTGKDGNAFSIIGNVSRALKDHGVSQEEIAEFRELAMAGDYNNLLQVCMAWVEVE